MVFKRVRQHNAMAEVKSTVWKIERDNFISLLEEFEQVKQEVIEINLKREY